MKTNPVLISFISWVAPSWAASKAYELVATPLSDLTSQSNEVTLSSGEKVLAWGDSSLPCVLMLHGWNGRRTQFAALGEALALAGFYAVAAHAPQHGVLEPQTIHLKAYSDLILSLSQELKPVALVGHSLGALCITLSLNYGLRIEKIILIAGPARYQWVLENIFKRLKLSPWAVRVFLKDLTVKIGLHPYKVAMDSFLKKDKSPSSLFIYDKHDKSVLFRNAEYLRSELPHKEIMVTENLGHNRILKAVPVIHKILSFLHKS